MFRTRSNYWGNSKFANWLRSLVNVEKPGAATLEDWDEWKDAYKNTHPFFYWLTEDFLDNVQNVVMYPSDIINEARYYFRNRFFDKLHYLPTKLKPGQYYDLDTRILHGLFESLVDFVEVEEAWIHVVFSEEERKKFSFPRWWRWKRFRCPEAGIAHLHWEMSLTNSDDPDNYSPSQAETAKEEYELYKWWKEVRPARPDPMDASGWSDICAREDNVGLNLLRKKNRTEEEEQETRQSLDRMREIEEAYDKEDEEMLIRLIKIRKSLWT